MSSKHFGELVPKLPKTCSSRFLAKRSWKKLKPEMIKITFTSPVDKKDVDNVVAHHPPFPPQICNQTMAADDVSPKDEYQPLMPHEVYRQPQKINMNEILLPHQIYRQGINMNFEVLLPHQICSY